ncbi:MAG: hypothetical protein ABIH28_02765 [archaeon]
MKNKKGFALAVGTVMACFVALLIFLGLASGGLGALWRTGSTVADIVDILGAIPPYAWVILGFFCLISLLGGRRKK